MLRRKGHVPTLLLFVVALVLCIAAWFSFLTFSDDIGQQSRQLQAFSDNVAFERTYADNAVRDLVASAAREANNGGDSGYEIRFDSALTLRAGKFGTFREVRGNFLGLMRNKAYTLERDGAEYVFKMPGVFVQMESGVNKVTQRFDIEVRFLPSGEIR
jgi:hypothetical protein